MKKRILLATIMVAVFVCLFAFAVSAAEPSYKDGEWIYAADGVTKMAIRDTDGNPLIWYMNGEELKYVRADQTDETQPVYVKYSISAGGSGFDTKVFSPEKTLKDIDIYDNGVQIECKDINSALVLFNMERLDIDAINGWLWGNKNGCCTKMRGIVLPSTLKGIGQEGFTNTKLVQIWNLENTQLEYINACSFANTSTLTQEATNGVFKLPHTLMRPIEIQSSQIKVYVMNPYYEYDMTVVWNQYFRNCGKLEKIIAPAQTSLGFGDEAFRDTAAQYLIMLTGTQEDAENLIANTKSSHNGSFKAAQVISYEAYLADMATYDNATNQVYVVYGYNYCDGFFDGTHDNSVTYGFANDEAYIGDYCKYEGCDRCGEKSTTVLGKLLVNKGYSISESGDGFTYDITFDKEVIAIYEEIEGTTFNYGIVAGKITEGDGGKIVTASGEKATDGVFTSLFTETSYELFNVKVTGVDTAEYKAKDVYLSAFVIDGEDVYYLGQSVTSEAVAISYDKIFELKNSSSDEE